MNCFHCQKPTNNPLRSIKTGKRGRPPKGAVCDKCIKVYGYLLDSSPVTKQAVKAVNKEMKSAGKRPGKATRKKKSCQKCGGKIRGLNLICTKCRQIEIAERRAERQKKKDEEGQKLTEDELRLLRYPPTEGTWCCPQHGGVNSAEQEVCLICGYPRGEEPVLLWPAYIIACTKAGIDPDDRISWSPNKTTKSRATEVNR